MRDHLIKQIQRFVLAASDMQQAAAAARSLQTTEAVHLAKALETAMVVCYARPFGANSGIGAVDRKRYAPGDAGLRKIHDDVISLRHTAYAHTDVESGRGVFDGAAQIGLTPEIYVEQWFPINRDALPRFVQLCEQQAQLFTAKSELLHAQLHALPPEP